MNVQRMVIYEQRRSVLEGEDLSEEIPDWIDDVIESIVREHTQVRVPGGMGPGQPLRRDAGALRDPSSSRRSSTSTPSLARTSSPSSRTTRGRLRGQGGGARRRAHARGRALPHPPGGRLRWREHLESMEYLRDGIHLRAMAQKDPLVEYRAEGHAMFEELGATIREEIVRYPAQVEHPGGEPSSSSRRAGAGRRQSRLRARGARGRRRDRAAGAASARGTAGAGLTAGGGGAAATSVAPASAWRRATEWAATTRAPAGRARSSRSATAPSRRRLLTPSSSRRDPRATRRLYSHRPKRVVARGGPSDRGRRGTVGAVRPGRYDPLVAERAAVERELEEIRAQLAWVRDYL